jgi:hypothetical protein
MLFLLIEAIRARVASNILLCCIDYENKILFDDSLDLIRAIKANNIDPINDSGTREFIFDGIINRENIIIIKKQNKYKYNISNL